MALRASRADLSIVNAEIARRKKPQTPEQASRPGAPTAEGYTLEEIKRRQG
jgi:hypothetical protein